MNYKPDEREIGKQNYLDALSVTRRSFLKAVAAASAMPGVATTRLDANLYELARADEPPRPAGPNDRIRIATIGMGIIGFIDTTCALKVPGIELVAAAAGTAQGRDRADPESQ